MKIPYSSLLLLAALAGPLAGAASADDTAAKSAAAKTAAPTDASIRELLRVSNAQKLLESVKGQVDAMTNMTIQQAAHGTPLSPQKQAIIDDMRTRMMAAFDEALSWDKLEPVYMHAYRDSFTQSELDGIIRFYKTPAGQAMVSKLPSVMKTVMTDMQGMLQPMQAKIQQIARESQEKLKAADAEPSPPQ